MKTPIILFVLSALFAVVLSLQHPYPVQVCISDLWSSGTRELIWTAGDNQFRTYDGAIFFDSAAFRIRVDTFAVTDDYNVSVIYDYQVSFFFIILFFYLFLFFFLVYFIFGIFYLLGSHYFVCFPLVSKDKRKQQIIFRTGPIKIQKKHPKKKRKKKVFDFSH